MIVYASRTGNVRHIVSKLGIEPRVEIKEGITLNITEPFLLVTYTDGLGDVPKRVKDFLRDNHTFCKGVVASGNTNFGHSLFCKSGDDISAEYGIPLVRKLELRGYDADYEAMKKFYEERVAQ